VRLAGPNGGPEAAGRVPVVSGVRAGSTREALQLGRLFREAGASALMVEAGRTKSVLILVVLAVCYLPARRAVHLDPTAAIRQD
jgi:hypothetical protein